MIFLCLLLSLRDASDVVNNFGYFESFVLIAGISVLDLGVTIILV